MDLRVTDRLELLLRKDIESMDCSVSSNSAHNTNLKKYTDFLESLESESQLELKTEKLFYVI